MATEKVTVRALLGLWEDEEVILAGVSHGYETMELEQVEQLVGAVRRFLAAPVKRRLPGGPFGELRAALDHFTQQPAGVGAEDCETCKGSREVLVTESDGQAPEQTFRQACPDCTGKARADSDGNQQPQGGDADAQSRRDDHRSAKSTVVAEGDSVQCGGVALEELLGWVEERRARCNPRQAGEAMVAYGIVARRIEKLLTQQQSSGRQEEDGEFFSTSEKNDKKSQEGEVEEADYERVARAFHGVYEATAPDLGYETRPESRVAWEDVPEKNRALMIGTVRRLTETGVISIPQPISDYKSGEGR